MEVLPTLWIKKYKIKNEAGLPIEFDNHFFLYDIYNDLSPVQAVLKAPQIGMTVLEVIKSLWVAQKLRKDIIYTLPTQADVNDMAGGKVNRIVAQNPILKSWVKNHDTVEQKSVGDSIIYYRGTWTNKQAMMVSSQLNIHDEVDASKQDVITQYETRLQAQTDGWRWYFSHPTSPEAGVDRFWQKSDQKHWFIKCSHCDKKQYMSWPDSVDTERKIYICKHCRGELSDDDRKRGEWIRKYKDREISGYWIPQLICPWIPASKIVDDFNTKPEEYFYNYVLGLPYAGKGNKVTLETIERNLTKEVNRQEGRIVIGCDTGLDLHFVVGNEQGLFYNGRAKDYDELEKLLKRWPSSVIVFDALGDLIGSRKLAEKYPGRVFLCFYGTDRKSTELVKWGKNEERMKAIADRNSIIQLLVDEFNDGKIPLQGVIDDWYDYYLHWSHIYRVQEEDALGVVKTKWERSDADHWVHATVYWRVGMDKFGKGKAHIDSDSLGFKEGPEIIADTVELNPLQREEKHDWRE